MIKCPRCEFYSVEFDEYFSRPRCFGFNCSWMPERCTNTSGCTYAFEPCDRCWGYEELRMGVDCNRCKNTGKILNALGREVLEVINGPLVTLKTSRVVVKQSATYSSYEVVELVNFTSRNIGSKLNHDELKNLISEGVEVVIK